MKKILIGGCSFSKFSDSSSKWKSWTDFMQEDWSDHFTIINRARSSFGQSKIAESIVNELIKNKFDVDFVFIQWSAVGRGYASNEMTFIERMHKQKQVFFAPHEHEYLIDGNLKQHDVTTMDKIVSKLYYEYSLTQIFLTKTLLQYHNIPYKMFWGWEQITPDLEQELSGLLDLIYDNNFIRFGKHGGMSEHIIKNVGVTKGILKGDFHPSTAGQSFFYDEVIKNIIVKEVVK